MDIDYIKERIFPYNTVFLNHIDNAFELTPECLYLGLQRNIIFELDIQQLQIRCARRPGGQGDNNDMPIVLLARTDPDIAFPDYDSFGAL